MSPEHARVFIAEDDKRWRRIVRRALEYVGHNVVLTASTLPEAIEKVKEFKDKGIQVAVIDGSMDSRNLNGGQDGQVLLRAIRSSSPEVKIIGMSSHPLKGVDKDVQKGNERFLGEVVKEL